MSVLPSSASLASFFVVFAIFLLLTLSPSIYAPVLRTFQNIDTTALRTKLTASNPSNRFKDKVILPHASAQPHSSASSQHAAVPEAYIDPSTVTNPFTGKPRSNTRLDRYLYALKPKGDTFNTRSLIDCKMRFPHPMSFAYFMYYVFWDVPLITLTYLIAELLFPLDQIDLYRNSNWRMASAAVKSTGWVWHPLAFVRDIFRAAFLPVWAVLIVCILVWSAVVFAGYIVGGTFYAVLGMVVHLVFSLADCSREGGAGDRDGRVI